MNAKVEVQVMELYRSLRAADQRVAHNVDVARLPVEDRKRWASENTTARVDQVYLLAAMCVETLLSGDDPPAIVQPVVQAWRTAIDRIDTATRTGHLPTHQVEEKEL